MNIYKMLMDIDESMVYELTYLGIVVPILEGDMETVLKYTSVKNQCACRHEFERAKQMRDAIYQCAEFSNQVNKLLSDIGIN